MTEKYIKNGQVAVAYSPGFGAGWSTWNDNELAETLLFHPDIINMILDGKQSQINEDWLVEHFGSDYERALALILAGDTSFVDQHSTEVYASRLDEGYERNKPMILDHSRVNEEYLYTFVDGKWVMV